MYATKYSLTEAATLTTLAVYLNYDTQQDPKVETAVYSDNAGTPQSLIVSSSIQTLFPNQWNYLSLPQTVLPIGTYWLAFQAASGTSYIYRHGTYPTANQDTIIVPQTFGGFPGSFPTAGHLYINEDMSIYAAYCPVTPYTPTSTGPRLRLAADSRDHRHHAITREVHLSAQQAGE